MSISIDRNIELTSNHFVNQFYTYLRLYVLYPSLPDEGYIRFVRTFAIRKNKLCRRHKVYILLLSIKFWIDLIVPICPPVRLCNIGCKTFSWSHKESNRPKIWHTHWKFLPADCCWKWCKSVDGHVRGGNHCSFKRN